MKKKLKVLVLSDGTRPTGVDHDLSKELKTSEWKTEANVMEALKSLGHTAEHLALFDDVDVLRQKTEIAVYRLRFNRDDAVQTQGHLEEDSAFSPHFCA